MPQVRNKTEQLIRDLCLYRIMVLDISVLSPCPCSILICSSRSEFRSGSEDLRGSAVQTAVGRSQLVLDQWCAHNMLWKTTQK